LWIAIPLLLLTGCYSPSQGFDSPEPSQRLRAVLRAAKEKDQTAVPKMIRFLNSDDPALRFASIRTLEELTGQTLGYDYAAPEWQRREQVKAWVEWNNRRKQTEQIPVQPSQTGPRNADTVPVSGK
jgi:HEAT repeat protein